MSRVWFLLSMCATSAAIAGRADAAIGLSPPQIALGAVGEGKSLTGSAALTSDATLAVTLQLGMTGDCQQFAILSPTSLTIGPTASTVTVRMTPTSSGPKTCALAVVQGAIPVASFELNGSGIFPQLTVDMPVVDFGPVELQQTATKALTLTNTGTATLFISGFGLLGIDPSISVSGNLAQLGPGDSTQLTLRCTPRDQGRHPELLTIESDSPGRDTELAVECIGTTGAILTTPSTLSFGNVLRGTTKLLSFTLSNPGNLPVSNLGAVIGSTGSGYSFDPATLPATLAPGESKLLTVAFTPATASGGGRATLSFTGTWGALSSTTTRTLGLEGSGTASGFQVAPTTLDFGAFVFDAAPQRTYQISNIGDTTIAIQAASFTPEAGTGPLEFTSVIRRAGAAVAPPQTLAPGELLDITVSAVPNHRTGLASGHIDIHTNIQGVADQRVAVIGTALAAALSAPAVVDFGTVDLHASAPSQTVMISNTGTATLDIASIAVAAGSSTAFHATLPAAAVQLAPGAALSIPVTYQPVVAQLPGAVETLTLVASIAGTLSGPDQAMIALRGRGIDRHLEIASTPTFPPTYRYPGSSAPQRPVTIHNAGEAPLVIRAVMLTGSPVWQLAEAPPVTILGGASRDVVISFAPTAVGPAPAGQLTLVDDDTAAPMAVIELTGTGVARSIAFDGAMIDVGTTAPGTSVQAAVTIRNLDASAPVTVRDIAVDDPAFSVVGAAGTQIPAGGSKTYTVRFAPTTAGAFHARATLYLDEDPDPQASVAFTGQSGTTASGSGSGSSGGGGDGGCNSGPGGAGATAVLAAIALLAGRRRRGPRTGRPTRR